MCDLGIDMSLYMDYMKEKNPRIGPAPYLKCVQSSNGG